jgi:FAD-linked oxidoreductase
VRTGTGRRWRNWGRTVDTRPAEVVTPGSLDEVAETVAAARARGLTVKAIGAGHSFSGIAETDGVLLDVGGLDGLLAVDAATGRVTLGAGTNLYQLPALLAPHGLALENMGDIDRQTIAGATQTGTHGTGARFGGLATRITGLTLITAAGTMLRIDEEENAELLPAARVGLGALGVVVDIDVQCVPAFLLRAVEHPEAADDVLDDFEARATGADHFECYWWPHTDRVMTRTNERLPADTPYRPEGRFATWMEERFLQNGVLGLKSALGAVLPAATPAINRFATRVYGDRTFTAPSYDVFTSPRDVRFREMEYAVPRAAVPDALREVRDAIDRNGWRISFPVEVRATAADDTWLSTAYGRESGYIAVHRYYREDPTEYFDAVERIMLAHEGRPHWGKMHGLGADDLRERYPRFDDFLAVRDRLDPDRVFANAYLRRVLGP